MIHLTIQYTLIEQSLSHNQRTHKHTYIILIYNWCIQCLGHSRKLQEILQNKELQDLIREIDGHSRPPEKLKIAMQLPVFREFVDECLAVCDQSNDDTS